MATTTKKKSRKAPARSKRSAPSRTARTTTRKNSSFRLSVERNVTLYLVATWVVLICVFLAMVIWQLYR